MKNKFTIALLAALLLGLCGAALGAPSSTMSVTAISDLSALGAGSRLYPHVYVVSRASHYTWSASSTATCNAITIVCPSPDPGIGRYIYDSGIGGVNCDGVTDNTSALQTLFNGGGLIQLPAGTCNFTTLSVPVSARIVGALNSAGSPVTILNSTSSTSADKIVVGGGGGSPELTGVRFEHLVINTPSAPSSASGIYFAHVRDSGMEDVNMLSLNNLGTAVKVQQGNTVLFRDMRIINPITYGFYIFGDDSHRSDVIELDNINVTGDSLSAHTHIPDAVALDGFVNTVVGSFDNFVNVGRGIVTKNTVGATQRAEYIFMYGLQVDFPYYQAIYSAYHDGMFFTDGYFHGSQTSTNIVILNTSPQTSTNFSFTGGQSTSAYQDGFFIDGRYGRITGMLISANSQQAFGTYPGIEIGPNTTGIVVTGNSIGPEAGLAAASQGYAIEIDAGATQYSVVGNSLFGNLNGAVLDHANATVNQYTAETFPNVGMIGAQSTCQNSPTSGQTINSTCALQRLTPAGTLGSLTVNLPLADHDGQLASLISTQTITSLTMTAAGAYTIDANSQITTLAPNVGVTWKFVNQSGTWIRQQ